MPSVDLNCDMGESFGAWQMGSDAAIMDFVTSVNIACGFHAGDASTMRRTVDLAAKKGLAIGAHPGYPDLQGFGRRNMDLSPSEVFDIVLYQVSALQGICSASGARLTHVKPHGALYNQAARDEGLAGAIADAVRRLDAGLVVFGLSGSFLITEARKAGLRTASEVFADRTYQTDGSLTPRSWPDALISETSLAVEQAVEMVTGSTVRTLSGDLIPIEAETVCIHGDGPHAAAFAEAIRKGLLESGVAVRPV